MANVYAVSAGNWSTPARWNTGSLPTSADDVYANGFAVTIDQDITVLSIQTRSNTGIAAGGSFTASSTRTINASVYAGTSTCLTLSGTSLTFNINATTIQAGNTTTSSAHGISCGGTTNNINITASTSTGASGSTAGNTHGITCGGTSNVYVINCTTINGGTSTGNNNYGVNFGMTAGTPSVTLTSTTINGGLGSSANVGVQFTNTVAMTYNVSGNVVASTVAYGMQFSTGATTTVNLNGNVTGASGGSSINGIQFSGSLCTLNVTGNVTGGSGGTSNYGIYSISTSGIVNIIGDVTGGAGTTCSGVFNNTTGTITISGTTLASTTSRGAENNSTGTLRCKTIQASTAAVALNGANSGGTTTFESAIFGTNGQTPFLGYCKLKTGTNNYIRCQLESGTKDLIDSANVANGQPAASDVRLGTVYNFGGTTGTLAVPLPSQVLSGVATDATVGTFTGATPPSASDNADAVWNRLTSAITTSGSIGEQIKNNLDTTVSSRLATSGYTTPPTSSQNADAVWDRNISLLTTSGSIGERAKNCSTVQTTGDQIVALT